MPDAESLPTMPASAGGGGVMNMTNGAQRADPTALTTQQLLREISNVAELLRAESQIQTAAAVGNRQLLNTRIDDLQKLVEFHATARAERFDLIEKQRVEQKADNEKAAQVALQAQKEALQAALQAQKEAVKEQTAASALAINKSEASTAAQQSQQYATITAELKAVTDRLGEQGNRLTTIESKTIGQTEQRGAQQVGQGALIGIAGLVIAFVLALITIYAVIPK